ncbi:MAG: T9SS type B sorting domain-containing protein, partial [Lutibacter sp.]
MQGLPPFIASLLLPIEITDNVTTENINRTTVKRCVGESYSVTAQNITGNPTYNWEFNGASISNTATLNLGVLSNTDDGLYTLTVETVDQCGFRITYKGELTLETYDPPTNNQPTDINQCDDDFDGFYDFDLHQLKDAEILNGQDNSKFEVNYFISQTDADSNQNIISMPFTNSNSYGSETIYYRIQNINSNHCYETGNFNINVYESPNPPSTITDLTSCDSNATGTDTDGIESFNLTLKNNEILNGQSNSDFSIAFFSDANLSQSITNPTNFVNSSRVQTIFASITNNKYSACIKTVSFNVEVHELPVINDYFELKQCDEDGTADGFTDFNLDEANSYLTNNNPNLIVTYYLTQTDAENGVQEVNASPFSNQTQSTVYARIENNNGCYRVAQLDLLVSTTHFNPNYLKTVENCDQDDVNDGISSFNLADNDADIMSQFPTGQNLKVSYYRNLTDVQLEQNEIPKNQPYTNETADNQTIYVRVESEDNGACFGFGPHLQLIVHRRPEFEVNSNAVYCKNLKPILLSTFNADGNYQYSWTDSSGTIISNTPEATISKEGEYSVVATSNFGCDSFTQTITVKPSIIATIQEDDLSITDDSDNNTITINTTNLGIGDYEFALDDAYGTYQDEPFFENVSPGIHSIYVNDKNRCGIAKIDVSVIGYPKFFTPNNDGINDTWKVLGVNENFYAKSLILIFNRFGKLVAKVDPKGDGWNGIFNGEYLPASDYWFKVELIDKNGNTKIRKGHFSLIRR